MTSKRQKPPPLLIRIFLPIFSIGSAIGALLSLCGLPIGLTFLIPLGLTYLTLYIWRFLEQAEGKEKAPGRAGRPGAEGR